MITSILLFASLIFLVIHISLFVTKQIEGFNSNTLCKKKSIIYRPTCDKRKIYDILGDMQTDISKIKYNVIREKTKSADYDFDEMYKWYKTESRNKGSNDQQNKRAAAEYAKKQEAAIDNATEEYKKKNEKKYNKSSQKIMKSMKTFNF